MRLDRYLYENSFTTSRNQAQELIRNNKVSVDGKIVCKASFDIDTQEVKILEEFLYVSRAALKLKAFLTSQCISVNDKRCLDIGSSTGGFVQVLCEFGAKHVTAVDVGRDQLDTTLKEDDRVLSVEQTDIRDFQSSSCFEFVTCDVSFVGISYLLEDIQRLACSEIVILFKPQFEVGRHVKRDKKGVVKDAKAIILALKKFEESAFTLGWKLLATEHSQLKGKAGNEEIFYYFKK